jgi:hypothetical protein
MNILRSKCFVNRFGQHKYLCTQKSEIHETYFFFCGSTAQFWALTASTKVSVSRQLLDLGQSAGLLGRLISSSQELC